MTSFTGPSVLITGTSPSHTPKEQNYKSKAMIKKTPIHIKKKPANTTPWTQCIMPALPLASRHSLQLSHFHSNNTHAYPSATHSLPKTMLRRPNTNMQP